MEIMYTREGITGSNPVLSADKKTMKKKTLITIFVFCLVLGVLYVRAQDGEIQNSRTEELEIKEDTVLDLNDSISIRQVRQMDSLHAAGKL